ncbi:MAG: glutamine-hydrolyzing GMP synthase, partial [Planctomycetia bacterium]
LDVWMSHGDKVTELPPGFKRMASTDSCPIAAMADEERRFYGLQFHPEVTHTKRGAAILERFVLDICGTRADWIMGDYIAEAVEKIRARVGQEEVILGLSGGVDSSVAAALIHRAIGDQLSCILVDNGLLRKNEAAAVIDEFTTHFKTDLHVVPAEKMFLGVLAGVTEPQEKRRRIGKAFVDCFADEAAKIKGAKFLAQGTLYPDVIESGAATDGPAATIKLHHNVGGLPEDLQFELIEPLRDLFKDEVRRLGLQLGLPERIVWRHPFPGPGLAVRCLGEVTKPRLDKLREADAIVLEEIERGGLMRKVSQAFAVLLPVQSVGVMGDARTYDDVLAVRAVETEEFMTADWSHLPYEMLARIS